MKKKSKKCVECGSIHRNSEGGEEIDARCFNCKLIVEMLDMFVKAQNQYIPLNGKPRDLEIISYRIKMRA